MENANANVNVDANENVTLDPEPVEAVGQDEAWVSPPSYPAPILAFERVITGATIPTQAHPGEDVGWDLYTSGVVDIPPGTGKDVHCGVALALPPGYWALLIARSSTYHDHGLLVIPSVIDPGYRGSLYVMVHNLGDRAKTIRDGQRIAQLVLIRIPELMAVHEMDRDAALAARRSTARGIKSSGSSGI